MLHSWTAPSIPHPDFLKGPKPPKCKVHLSLGSVPAELARAPLGLGHLWRISGYISAAGNNSRTHFYPVPRHQNTLTSECFPLCTHWLFRPQNKSNHSPHLSVYQDGVGGDGCIFEARDSLSAADILLLCEILCHGMHHWQETEAGKEMVCGLLIFQSTFILYQYFKIMVYSTKILWELGM